TRPFGCGRRGPVRGVARTPATRSVESKAHARLAPGPSALRTRGRGVSSHPLKAISGPFDFRQATRIARAPATTEKLVGALPGMILPALADVRKWRNWQTRQIQVLVDLTVLGGSSPPFRTNVGLARRS